MFAPNSPSPYQLEAGTRGKVKFSLAALIAIWVLVVPDVACSAEINTSEQPVPNTTSGATATEKATELKGFVFTNTLNDSISERMNELFAVALHRSEKMQELNKAFFHYKTMPQRLRESTLNALNYAFLDRGDMPSSEAGDVILNEKLKLKNKASAEYARQKQCDEIETKIATSILQLSMGLGMQDRVRGEKLVSSGIESLKPLVGEEEAARTKDYIAALSAGLLVPNSVFEQEVWDADQHQVRLQTAVWRSLQTDPVVSEIRGTVHKYNHHSRLYRVSSRVFNTGLGVASLTPTLIGPAAQLALLTYVMATGGPEEDKLMRELYLDKRLQSRCTAVTNKSQMALDRYQIALLTHNALLLLCSQSIVRQMVGDEAALQIFGQTPLPAVVDSQSMPSPKVAHVRQSRAWKKRYRFFGRIFAVKHGDIQPET